MTPKSLSSKVNLLAFEAFNQISQSSPPVAADCEMWLKALKGGWWSSDYLGYIHIRKVFKMRIKEQEVVI